MTILDNLSCQYGDVIKMSETAPKEAISRELEICFDAKRLWELSSKRHMELVKERDRRAGK